MYKVERAQIPVGEVFEPRYLITKDGECLDEVNRWIEINSMSSYNTGKKYAHILVRYFNYLESLNITYDKVTKKSIINGFIRHLLYGDGKNFMIEGKTSISLVKNYIGVIKNFYFWLEDELIVETNPVLTGRSSSNYSHVKDKFLYGQIYNLDINESVISKLRGRQKRTYLKWLTDEQIEGMSEKFTIDRDKCIFMVSHETGARIGEILGIKLKEYDSHERVLKIRRDTTNPNEALVKTIDRDLYISEKLADALDNYILGERSEIESDIGLCDYLFLTTKGKNKGLSVKYATILKSFKKAGKKAGLNPDDIITHSGRSTRAQKLIELAIEYPEIGITDNYIQDEFGWESIDTLKHYKKKVDSRLRKNITQKINEVNRKDSNQYRKEISKKINDLKEGKHE